MSWRLDPFALTDRPSASYNPLASWIWLGAAIMFAGGLLSLTDRRLRIGVPKRAAAAVPQAAE